MVETRKAIKPLWNLKESSSDGNYGKKSIEGRVSLTRSSSSKAPKEAAFRSAVFRHFLVGSLKRLPPAIVESHEWYDKKKKVAFSSLRGRAKKKERKRGQWNARCSLTDGNPSRREPQLTAFYVASSTWSANLASDNRREGRLSWRRWKKKVEW